MMKLLFEPSTEARFEWDDWGTPLRGRRVLKFSYHITRDRSNYHLTTGEPRALKPLDSGGRFYQNWRRDDSA